MLECSIREFATSTRVGRAAHVGTPSSRQTTTALSRILVLMCVEHASTIDELMTLPAYPADLLRQWKAKQLEEV